MPESERADALSDQSSLAQQLLGAVGQAVVATDLAGSVIFWNRGAELLFGWPEHEALGASLSALILPTQHLEVATRIVDAVLAGETWTGEFPVVHRSGEVRRVLVTDSAITDESGAVVGVVGVSTDITDRIEMERSLRRNEERLLERFEQSDMPQLALDVSGTIAAVNSALCRLLKQDHADVVGVPLFELFQFELLRPDELPGAPDSASPEGAPLDAMLDGRRTSLRTECIGRSGAGERLVLQVDLTVLRDHDGTAYGFDGHVQDLSELRRVEQALRRSESRHRVIADTAQEGIWAVDLDGRALYANRMTAELLRRDLDEIYASTPSELFGLDPAAIERWLHAARTGGPTRTDQHYRAPDGTERVLRVSVADLPDDTGRRIVGILLMISDVTDVVAAQAELTRRALQDPLTGLGNRTLLVDRLTHAMNRSSRRDGEIAVLFVDLDHLKEVNDSFGHAEGDELLREVARRIARSVRPGDTVARFGGDEFVVLCEEIDEEGARDVADRLLTVLAEPAQLRGGAAVPSASIGVAVAPPSEPEALLREADAAMYEAKRRGRAQIVLRAG